MSIINMWSLCDRCGFKFRRGQLRAESTGWVVCNSCHDGKFGLKNHPQNYAPRPRKEPTVVPDGRADQTDYSPPPLVLANFRSGDIPSSFTFSRNGAGLYFNSAGQLVSAAIDEPRIDYAPATLVTRGLRLEQATTNFFTNPYAVGTIAGTPGTEPTAWDIRGTANGITRQIIGRGLEEGIPYVDLRFSGTSTASINTLGVSTRWQVIPAAVGETWTGIGAWKLLAGNLTGVTSPSILILQYLNNLLISGLGDATAFPTSANLKNQIYSISRTLTAPTVNNVGLRLRMQISAGTTIDFTLRVSLLVLTQTVQPSSLILPAVDTITTSSIATETASLGISTSDTEVEILQQDLAGYAWSIVPLVGNTVPITLRDGQSHILRFGAWPAYRLTPLQKQTIAEQF